MKKALKLFCTFTLIAGFTAGCGQSGESGESGESGDFDYVGKLSAIMPNTGGTILQLSVDGSDYELVLREDTEYIDIQVTPMGTVWSPGGFYGVNGELRGQELIVESITSVPSLDGIPIVGATEEEAFEAWLEKKCAQLEAEGKTDQSEWDCS